MHRRQPTQPVGSSWFHVGLALLSATSGCARGIAERIGDAAVIDAAPAEMRDAARDASHSLDALADAVQITADTAPSCAIAIGVSPMLDGTQDLAAYPSAQQLAPGAMMGTDAAAVAYDRDRLYVTVASSAFAGGYEPLHVYVQAIVEPDVAAPAQGKEYSGLVPALPFSPTHLIAIRRVSDSGTGAYDGVYTSANAWATRATALAPMTDVFVDDHALSVQVPWTALGGCPTSLRLALHVVHAVAGSEWKDLVPSTHTPWQAPGGGYYEIDLSAPPAIANWTLH